MLFIGGGGIGVTVALFVVVVSLVPFKFEFNDDVRFDEFVPFKVIDEKLYDGSGGRKASLAAGVFQYIDIFFDFILKLSIALW